MKVKYIYWFAFYNLHSPSVRYRGYYPLQELKKQGVQSVLVTPGYRPDKILRFIRAYFSALFFRKKDSVIVIQRVRSNFIYARLLKLLVRVHKQRTIYDLDDADYLEHPPKTIFFFARKCSMVVTGSTELAQRLSSCNSNVVVNTSPTPDLGICKQTKNGILEIGWIGCFGGGHKQSLINQFFPAITQLTQPVKLTLLGVNKKEELDFLQQYFKNHPHITLHAPHPINWLDEMELQKRIQQFDMGIATLLDDELHRCKSAFKAKQYLNNGVPVLSSDICENNRFIKNGVNGYLCADTNEFKKRINEIAAMGTDEYFRLSNQARQSAPEFDITAYNKRMVELY